MNSCSILYVIGNGFDIAHELYTSYKGFEFFLKGSDQYNELKYIIETTINAHELWSDFEENLGNFDIYSAIESVEDLLPESDSERDGDKYACGDRAYEIVKLLTHDLRCAMRDWILSVKIIGEQKFSLNTSAYFLSFNYTTTLEKLYCIDNVCHIHGIAEKNERDYYDEDSTDIVVGHTSTAPEIKENCLMAKDFSQHYALEGAYNNFTSYWDKSQKRSMEIIDRHKSFFNSISDVDTVVVIGHSLSKVDIEYFKAIANSVNKNTKWQITYFGDKEKEIIQQQAKMFCPDLSTVKFIDLDIDIDIMELPQC